MKPQTSIISTSHKVIQLARMDKLPTRFLLQLTIAIRASFKLTIMRKMSQLGAIAQL